jgi:hypothetical protein
MGGACLLDIDSRDELDNEPGRLDAEGLECGVWEPGVGSRVLDELPTLVPPGLEDETGVTPRVAVSVRYTERRVYISELANLKQGTTSWGRKTLS